MSPCAFVSRTSSAGSATARVEAAFRRLYSWRFQRVVDTDQKTRCSVASNDLPPNWRGFLKIQLAEVILRQGPVRRSYVEVADVERILSMSSRRGATRAPLSLVPSAAPIAAIAGSNRCRRRRGHTWPPARSVRPSPRPANSGAGRPSCSPPTARLRPRTGWSPAQACRIPSGPAISAGRRVHR